MGTEQEIFDSEDDEAQVDAELHVQPEEAKAPPPEEQAAQQPPAGDKQPEQAAEGAAPQPEQPKLSDAERGILKDLLDTRERAQRAERERDEARQRADAFEREKRASQQKPAEPPDMFVDPDGFRKTMVTREELAELQLKQDIEKTEEYFARLRLPPERGGYGEEFTTAWNEFRQAAAANPMLEQAFDQLKPWQRGEEVVSWHRQQKALREVGTDPAAYRQKVLDEALKDPAFMAKALEQARAQAGGAQTNGSRPSNVTRLPSLNRSSSAASAREPDDGDDSEEAIWEAGNAARR